jgi:hypothetical protein
MSAEKTRLRGLHVAFKLCLLDGMGTGAVAQLEVSTSKRAL